MKNLDTNSRTITTEVDLHGNPKPTAFGFEIPIYPGPARAAAGLFGLVGYFGAVNANRGAFFPGDPPPISKRTTYQPFPNFIRDRVAPLAQSNRALFWRELSRIVEGECGPPPADYDRTAWALENASDGMLAVALDRVLGDDV